MAHAIQNIKNEYKNSEIEKIKIYSHSRLYGQHPSDHSPTLRSEAGFGCSFYFLSAQKSTLLLKAKSVFLAELKTAQMHKFSLRPNASMHKYLKK